MGAGMVELAPVLQGVLTLTKHALLFYTGNISLLSEQNFSSENTFLTHNFLLK